MTVCKPKDPLIFPEHRKILQWRDSHYWWTYARGRALGYQRGLRKASWFARVRLKDGRYHQTWLGEADDDWMADGGRILSFDQAFDRANSWCEQNSKLAIPRYLDHEHEPVYPKLPPAPPYTVAHAMVDYMQWIRENRLSFPRIYYNCRELILPKLGDIPLEELTTRIIRQWFDELAESPSRKRVSREKKSEYQIAGDDPERKRRRQHSVNTVLGILKAGLNRAYEYGYVDSDMAWRRVKKFRNVVPWLQVYLEIKECRALLRACPQDLRNLVKGALVSGCRVGELKRMRVCDYRKDLKRLIVTRSKNGRPHHVSLPKEGALFFNHLTKGRPTDENIFLRGDGRAWWGQTYYRPFLIACDAADINPKANFHSLRHTYASHAVMAGILVKVVAKQLGHQDTRMVERFYAHLGSSYVDEVIQKRMPKLIS